MLILHGLTNKRWISICSNKCKEQVPHQTKNKCKILKSASCPEAWFSKDTHINVLVKNKHWVNKSQIYKIHSKLWTVQHQGIFQQSRHTFRHLAWKITHYKIRQKCIKYSYQSQVLKDCNLEYMEYQLCKMSSVASSLIFLLSGIFFPLSNSWICWAKRT